MMNHPDSHEDPKRPKSARFTEDQNPVSKGIDRKSSEEIVEIIHREDLQAWHAVGGALKDAARLVDLVMRAFQQGGRLIYVGAGTSGRLGMIDAAECPPTFGVDPNQVMGIIAGGEAALQRSVEGAEDSFENGARAVRSAKTRDRDVVCGIATSGTTPFVIGAIEEAMRRDATTALITCNSPDPELASVIDIVIELPVGPEVVAGSTRMKGGTATKMVLNMVTTAAMVRWGKVYDNLMVDLRPINQKLAQRALNLIERLGPVNSYEATELFRLGGGNVKVAIVMARLGIREEEARKLLEENGWILRDVIDRDRD